MAGDNQSNRGKANGGAGGVSDRVSSGDLPEFGSIFEATEDESSAAEDAVGDGAPTEAQEAADTSETQDDGPQRIDSPSDLPAFDADDVGEQLRYASADALNAADYGIIVLDDDGVVQFYNKTEADFSGVSPDEAVGSNFFTEVSPCSNNRLFYGQFKEGVREGEIDNVFSYTFTYKMKPTLVDIRIYRGDAGLNWVLVQPQS
jgi:photoactive yellow protein